MLAMVVAIVLAGCGLESQASTGAVRVMVTRDFGSAALASATVAGPSAGATAFSLLERRFRVVLAAGDSVRAIDGVQARPPARWQLYVDGVAAGGGARIHPGDRLWWNLEASRVKPPAVVGSFPEPFLHSLGGRRYPTTLECAGDVQAACRRVAAVLGHAGVPASPQLLGAGSGQDSLAVVVGTWRDIRAELAATLLSQGPTSSGVFARFVGGREPSLQLLNVRGMTVATLKHQAGVVAALAQPGAPPTWLVVGTDVAGTIAAAKALSASRLHDRFALAVSGGRDLPLPR